MAATDLYRPETYVDAPPHDELTRLRAAGPVAWQDTPGGGGYWMVLRHADVVEVSRRPDLYSAELGGVVIEDLNEQSLIAMRQMLLAMDPPRHGAHRRNISPNFRARIIGQMEDRIREISREILDRAAQLANADGEVDFVHDVAAHLPSQVVGELMGLPEEDWPLIHAMAERNSGGQDPDINPGATDELAGSAAMDMAMYALGHAQRRREEGPREDLTTLILDAEVDGASMTDAEFASFFVQLVTAGNDTTRTMLSSGLLAFLEHPEQLAAVRADPALLPGAVEEILRWANPLHYFRRTTTQACELAGHRFAADEKVVMMYTSANRDERVFDRPHDFDISRDPNPHLSFGVGEHFCLGAHLARLEGRVFFEEVLARFSDIAVTGDPKRQQSNLNNSLKHLPVRLAS